MHPILLLALPFIALQGHHLSLRVSNAYFADTELVERYCRRNSVNYVVFSSTGNVVDIYLQEKSETSFISTFCNEFGASTKRLSGGTLELKYSLVWYALNPKETAATLVRKLDNGSLLACALNKLIKDKKLLPGETVEHCSYSIRPWITTAMATGELLSGEVDISGTSSRTVSIWFES